MAKRDHTSLPAPDDWHLWSEVTRSVSPLRPPARPRNKPVPAAAGAPGAAPESRHSVTAPHPAPPRWSPGMIPTRHKPQPMPPGRVIEPGIKRALVRGHTAIDGTIDLHGLRQSEAHAALCRFIAARYGRGDRTLLVITGKGLRQSDDWYARKKGVLRVMLPVWLSEAALAPMIAGWDISTRAHGGEGAFYVRLRQGTK